MNHPVLPVPILEGVQRSYSISALWEGTPARATVEKERELLNLVLPPWQRDLCWTLEQQIKYIEGIFLGLGTGYYVVNGRDFDNDGSDTRMSGWLIDGQQRITAIARFISGEICIFGGIFYRDLSPADKRRRFDSIIFPCIELNYQEDETVLKELYRRLNYGGTPHTQEDLALLNP